MKLALITTLFFTLSGCSILMTQPDQLTQKQRFAQLKNDQAPVDAPVSIYWDKHSIPFIEAQNEKDLAFAVGVVHAHLRIDQMEVFRKISQGRLSEVAGPVPLVKHIDQLLRVVNLKGSAKRSVQKMSAESLEWMTQFKEGINWYIANLKETPVTNKIFDEELKPYTLVDVIAISRLVTADLSWGTYVKYLSSAHMKGWEQAFHKSLEKRKTDSATHNNATSLAFSQLIHSFSKSGSNSIAISGKKTRTGSAMIASDPHVGLFLPNFWILMGIKSPQYHAFGMMIPGAPVIGVGRNKDIAWGGTNMRGISSHLYDVSELPKKDITIRKEEVKRRWWATSEFNIRETPYGPILTDVELFDPKTRQKPLALDWRGRKGSDEIQSLLDAMRASNWQEFKKSFENYKVSAMNLTYADKQGNIGMVAAYAQPVLKDPSRTLDFIKKTDNPIVGEIRPVDHPNPFNPEEGFIASANNKPFSQPRHPIAFNFATSDRVNRLKQLARKNKKVSLLDLKALQLDVYNQNAMDITQLLIPYLPQKTSKQAMTLAGWNGEFRANSEGAVSFFALSRMLWTSHIDETDEKGFEKEEILEASDWKDQLLKLLKEKPKEWIQAKVTDLWPDVLDVLEESPRWGDFTRQKHQGVFGALPLIGSSYRLGTVPVSGGNDTLNKYGRTLDVKPADVFYGASSRHISDLSSLDENYFVLNGGQDSWLMNDNIADQTKLWQKGEYIKIPLSMDKVREQFNQARTTLRP